MVATRGVLLVAAVAAGLLLAGCGVSRSNYIAGNEAIAKALPVFPGAVKIHEFSTPDHSDGEFADPSGYTTTVVYRVPRGTRRAAVLRFFEFRLRRRGWQSRAEGGTSARVRGAIADFTRAGALVVVNTLLLTSAREPYAHWLYEIEVDHRGG